MSQSDLGPSSAPKAARAESRLAEEGASSDESRDCLTSAPSHRTEAPTDTCLARCDRALAETTGDREDLTRSLSQQIALLEAKLVERDERIQMLEISCDDLRERLKRERHYASQLKAALERCLESEAPSGFDSFDGFAADFATSDFATRDAAPPSPDWAIAEEVTPLPEVAIVPPAVPVEASDSTDPPLSFEIAAATAAPPSPVELPAAASPSSLDELPIPDFMASPVPSPALDLPVARRSELPRVTAPEFLREAIDTEPKLPEPAPTIAGRRQSPSSLAAVKLPTFPPLSRR